MKRIVTFGSTLTTKTMKTQFKIHQSFRYKSTGFIWTITAKTGSMVSLTSDGVTVPVRVADLKLLVNMGYYEQI